MNNWVKLLLITEHVLSKRNSKIIKFSPFQALHGYYSENNNLLDKKSLLENIQQIAE